MPRLLLALTLCAAGCGGPPAEPSPRVPDDTLSLLRQAIRQRLAGALDVTLERVELSRFEEDADLYVALFDWQARWWGDFVVFCAADGELRWTAVVSEEDEPAANYGVSARGFRLPGFPDPLVEVFWSSHMGNGSLYLYEVRDRSLHLLLETTAVDNHWGGDGCIFRGGTLSASYQDVDGDGLSDLTLSGFMDRLTLDADGDPAGGVSASVPVRQTFLWKADRRTFERRDP